MKQVEHKHDLVIAGAGLAGLCAAITAARAGLRVALVQDRPVLGGNSSKEIRVPPVGSRCCSFAYSKETGLVEDLMLENLKANPTCSAEGWNLILLNQLKKETNIDVFFNTYVSEVNTLAGGEKIASVRAYTSNAEIWHTFSAPYFADCTGDGTVALMAGAPFRWGIEARKEFGESLAREEAQFFTMGSSIWFTTRDAGRPVPFERPHWVKRIIQEDDFGKFRSVLSEFKEQRGGFWWLELGGDRDMIHDTPKITDDLLALVYGVWDYLKNRSELRDKIETWELDWVGALPGKRETRRFEGDHILSQCDIEQQRAFEDAVACGGWGFDHHPKDGFFDRNNPSFHLYHAGPYNIPLRSLYSRKVTNLFLAGRNISATHYALSSTRVMLTCAQLGEAIGMAAVVSQSRKLLPKELIAMGQVAEVQRRLLKNDHHLHDVPYDDESDLARKATVSASTALSGPDLVSSDGVVPPNGGRLWQFPVATNQLHAVEVLLDVTESTQLSYSIHRGAKNNSTYPETVLFSGSVQLTPGKQQWVTLPAKLKIPKPGWHFLELSVNPSVSVHFGRIAPTGLLGYDHRKPDPIRVNEFSQWKIFKSNGAADVWNVEDGQLRVRTMDALDGMVADGYCVRVIPPQPVYEPANVINPWARPTNLPNLWISQPTDFSKPEFLELHWENPQKIESITLLFDSSLDFHVTSLWMKYKRNTIPSLIKDYQLHALNESGAWQLLASEKGNYLRHKRHQFSPVVTKAIRLEIFATNGLPRAQVYAVRVYGPQES